MRRRSVTASSTAIGCVLLLALAACGDNSGQSAATVAAAATTAAPVTTAATTTTLPATTSTSSTTTSTTTSTTSPATTTSTIPATLPNPESPPADPRAAETLTQVGTIEIPKIGVSKAIYEGITLTTLDHGPGHWPGTAMPGQPGNVVIPGHRTAGPHPFLDIARLQDGDQIVLSSSSGRFVYAVSGTAIVSPDDSWITAPTADPTLTLYACHPKGSDGQRYVVFARLVAPADASGRASSPEPTSNSPSQKPATPPPSCGFLPCIRR